MKIIKYSEFIKEEMNDTPEQYVETALKQIKSKIDKMFEFQEGEESQESDQENGKKSINKAKFDSRKKTDMSFKDLGIRLESSEISKYSQMYASLTVKFSDDEATYNLFISSEVKEAIPKDPEKDFNYKDIEKCYVKFKKYNKDTFEVLGQLTKNVKIDSIDEDFLIELKFEIDEDFGDKEEFKIETN